MNGKLKTIILTAIVCFSISGIGVVAVNILANDIGFTPNDEEWQVNNVNDAMNDLYELTDKPASKTISFGIRGDAHGDSYFSTLTNGYNTAVIKYTYVFDAGDGGSVASQPTILGTSVTKSGTKTIDISNKTSIELSSGWTSGSWQSYVQLSGTITLSE